MTANKMVFAAYAESTEQLSNIGRLAESLRAFGGRFREAPVWASIPDHFSLDETEIVDKLHSLGVDIRTCHTPEDARWFYYAGKVYAAGEAEIAATNKAEILIWMDEDTIVLSEPDDFDLGPGHSFAYRPVMHNRSGSLCDASPDAFWGRIYEKLSLTDEMLFPMVTPADKQTIRAYFQAGILVVRPERGILRRWPGDFELLYRDETLTAMCKDDPNKRIFLHQTALVGSIINTTDPEEMLELSDRYNYPLFFEQGYGADESFDSIEDVITLRCVVREKNLAPDWRDKITGPPEKVTWLKNHLYRY